jgi:hypothetical protein
MRSDELSVKERAVLFALLAEACALSNPELEERVGLRLDGRERRKLNDLKLVVSTKIKRAFVHELTDAGWIWCANQLSAGPAANAGSMERALYAILSGLGRYLHGTDQRLADIFSIRYDGSPQENRQPEESARDVEASILAGYSVLAGGTGDFIKLSALRQHLADVPQDEIDAALDTMYQEQRINLIPQSNQRALTAADRKSALRIGGEEKYLISVRPR